MPVPHVHVAIVGSGFAGLGAAIRLRAAGERDLVIFERAGDIGGTWRDNRYPGCACDVPSHLYSFSFALNPGWRRTFSPGEEIWAYLKRVAERFGVLGDVRLRHEVLSAAWDGTVWRIATSHGDWTADVLVSAAGALSEPAVPALPGIERFTGAVFHSARWDHGLDLAGRRVAVIGTGASAIQFVPQIQPRVERLHVFQRTAPWIIPRTDRPLRPWEHRLYRRLPAAQRLVRSGVYVARELIGIPFLHPRFADRLERIAHRHLARAVRDPELRDRLTPRYRIGCKRILISNDYLPALTRENAELVTAGIREVLSDGIATDDGVERALDTIIFATGFRVTAQPIAERIRGRAGTTLAEAWAGSPHAHLGTTVPGFPNLFLLAGPNTGLGHTSVLIMLEAQIGHVVDALAHLRATGGRSLEPRPGAEAGYLAGIDRRMASTVWATGGCDSWYIDATGRNSTLWPGHTWSFRRRLRRLDPAEYAVT
jgi:cation diffusion facilitator CzcD-associated flavoprotein CzcO